MARWDETGIFWDDYIPPKIKKEKIKREPPEPIWLLPNYLPGFEEAKAYKFDLMSDGELLLAKGQKFVWDIEIYPNYLLIGFMHIETRKIVMFEARVGEPLSILQIQKLMWIFDNMIIVGFNDNAFDIPMAVAILANFTTEKLYECADLLINGAPELGLFNGTPPFKFYRIKKLKSRFFNNIDLRELTPLGPGLKVCAGRLHAKRMADLPFKPGTILSDDQITVLRYYWVNDLENTLLLFNKYKQQIELREILGAEYKIDVRSKSDPQVAEAIIRAEIQRITGRKYIEKAEIVEGAQFGFSPPSYISYETENLQWVLDLVRRVKFSVDAYGGVEDPEALRGIVIPIGNSNYRIGVGGLHSTEKKMVHVASDDFELSEDDVTSYYPSLMIQQGMYPPNVGPVFLQVFERIYHRRLHAKSEAKRLYEEGSDLVLAKKYANDAETLKIVLNGTFGKTGERGGHSVVYYPRMMVQVTLSGQLSLLMLIEWLELAGISVISANTDGIVTKCPKHLIETKKQIMQAWEKRTGLGLESTKYKAMYSRDVNNYIALYNEPSKKETDGFRYAKAIGTYRKTLDSMPMKWNPTCDICAEAVIVYLATGKSVEETIRECTDVRKFIEVRRVAGGGYKDGEYLGKAVRWYYSTADNEPIINAANGNTVNRSAGGRPCMILPEAIPEDLNYQEYFDRAYMMLEKELSLDVREKAA